MILLQYRPQALVEPTAVHVMAEALVANLRSAGWESPFLMFRGGAGDGPHVLGTLRDLLPDHDLGVLGGRPFDWLAFAALGRRLGPAQQGAAR